MLGRSLGWQEAVRVARLIHTNAVMIGREGIRTSYAMRSKAASGSNMQLDPRGVDYGLFEAPTEEYRLPNNASINSSRTPTNSEIPPAIALLKRLVQQGSFVDASHALEQLKSLNTPLDVPLVDYITAARHFAALGHADEALRWLELAPTFSELPSPADAKHASWQFNQTMHWLTNLDTCHLRRACNLAASKHYLSALTTGVTHIFRTGSWLSEGALQTYTIVVAEPLEQGNLLKGADRVKKQLYNRVIRAMVHGGFIEEANELVKSISAQPVGLPLALDFRTEALLHGARPNADGISVQPKSADYVPERETLNDSIRNALFVSDLDSARRLLLQTRVAPSTRVLSQFLAQAGEQSMIGVKDFTSDESPKMVATGRFLRPVRKAMERLHRSLYDTALLYARESEKDWHGVLRVYQRRFQPIQALDANLLLAAEQIPHSLAQTNSHATRSHRNSVARPRESLERKIRHLTSPSVAASVVRAIVALCAHDQTMYQRLYTHCMTRFPQKYLSVRLFEVMIPGWSACSPHSFVQRDSGPMWCILRDMQKNDISARAKTWTLMLQALIRDGSHENWELAIALLRRMSCIPGQLPNSTDDLLACGSLPEATPGIELSGQDKSLVCYALVRVML
ncbi:hypothetical protein MYAM1_001033 [Malassezia yamatoensis]|uniref:Uncharacterized protein n=1 Tax=Malassezia yamatoensis TaxID=253288 RepID=A0AAJ6CFH2_9BASI|nr:hypothetical protein MYAM1_001033 [Malassezia yamatoensis]